MATSRLIRLDLTCTDVDSVDNRQPGTLSAQYQQASFRTRVCVLYLRPVNLLFALWMIFP